MLHFLLSFRGLANIAELKKTWGVVSSLTAIVWRLIPEALRCLGDSDVHRRQAGAGGRPVCLGGLVSRPAVQEEFIGTNRNKNNDRHQ